MKGLEGDDRQVNRDIVRYFESQKSDDNEVKAGSTADVRGRDAFI